MDGERGLIASSFVGYTREIRLRPGQGWRRLARRHGPAATLIAGIGGWRLLQSQGLALPAWVDSVHHTLLVRILLEQRGIPDTWGPLLPAVPLYYHFGFHASAALLAAALGVGELELGRAVLLAGVLWQAGIAWGTYAVGRQLWPSRARALTATALVGFVSQMPAYYVTWGRYTLLAGLTLLLAAMAALLARRHAAFALLVAGLAVTHYYALFLGLLFAAAVFAATRDRARRVSLCVSGAAGLLAASPWLARVWHWTRAFQGGAAPSGGGGPSPEASVWALLGPTRGHVLLVLGLFGLACLAARALRREGDDRVGAGALALWSVAVAALAGPWHLGPFRPDHAAIVAFVPITLCATEFLFAVCTRRQALALLAALVAWGAVETRSIVRPDSVLATRADLVAIGWAAGHTPGDAVFMVDVEPWMGVFRGADGGWWLSPLAGRRTLLPPLAYTWGPPENRRAVLANAERVRALGGLEERWYCPELEHVMAETGALYYYTRSARPLACPGLAAVFSSAPPVRIFRRLGAPK